MNTRHEFDIKQDHQKNRDAQGFVTYVQNGCKFTAGGDYIGKEAKPEDTPEKRAEDKESVRKRAVDKISRLDGFKPSEKPDAIQEALNENQAARQAEEHVE